MAAVETQDQRWRTEAAFLRNEYKAVKCFEAKAMSQSTGWWNPAASRSCRLRNPATEARSRQPPLPRRCPARKPPNALCREDADNFCNRLAVTPPQGGPSRCCVQTAMTPGLLLATAYRPDMLAHSWTEYRRTILLSDGSGPKRIEPGRPKSYFLAASGSHDILDFLSDKR